MSLQIIGFFGNNLELSEIDRLKKSEEKYITLLEIIEDYYKTITDSLMKNILTLIKICVSYDPQIKTAKELEKIIKGFDKKEYKKILEESSLFISNWFKFYL